VWKRFGGGGQTTSGDGIPELLVHLNVEFCACFAWQIRTRSSSIGTTFEYRFDRLMRIVPSVEKLRK
jgi:hypothetical protein